MARQGEGTPKSVFFVLRWGSNESGPREPEVQKHWAARGASPGRGSAVTGLRGAGGGGPAPSGEGTYIVFCFGRDRRPVTAARGLFCKRSYLPQDNCCAPRGAAEKRLKMFFVHKPVPLCPRKPKAGLCVCTVGSAGQNSTTTKKGLKAIHS